LATPLAAAEHHCKTFEGLQFAQTARSALRRLQPAHRAMQFLAQSARPHGPCIAVTYRLARRAGSNIGRVPDNGLRAARGDAMAQLPYVKRTT
jgi:hypothetical protein